MNIGFIGAGKVGSSFGHFLSKKGLNIEGYYSKSESSSIDAAKLTNSSPLDFDELISKCDFIFITTPDDEIEKVWQKMKDYDLHNKKIFHMSGATSKDIFSGYRGSSTYFYSLHPIYSFASRESSDLEEVIFSLEADKIDEIQDFLDTSKIKYFPISSSHKPKYHSATVFASNYLVALIRIAEDLLYECGLDRDFAFKALAPLIYGSLDNIREKGSNKALTGPIARGDLKTIENHLQALDKHRQAYQALGAVALEITEENKSISQDKLEKLEELLRGVD